MYAGPISRKESGVFSGKNYRLFLTKPENITRMREMRKLHVLQTENSNRLEGNMRIAIIGMLLVLVVACDRYPANPPKDFPDAPKVEIAHLHTEYVEVDTTINGIASDKVNVLSFYIKAENFTAKALELYGRAAMAGPPDSVEHVVHFKTDDLSFDLNGTGYEFNILDYVNSESSYILVRPKFPSNEYSPFEGIQGKIESITITEVWAWPEIGEKFSVSISGE